MKRRFAFFAFLFAYGFSALMVQTLILREYMVQFWGSELSVSLVFFAWFLGIAIGAVAFGLFDRRFELFHFAVLPVGFVLLALDVFLTSFARVLLGLSAGELAPTVELVIGALVFVLPAGVGVGVSFPAIARIVKASGLFGGPRTLWSAMFGVEAIGSLTAGVLFTYVLVGVVDPFVIAVLTLAFGLLCLGALAFAAGMSRSAVLSVAFALAVLVFVGVWGGGLVGGVRGVLYERLYPGQEVVAHIETPYQRLELTEKLGQFNLYADGRYAVSFPDPRRHAFLAHAFLCMHPAPERVLFLGGGIEGVAQHALLHPVRALEIVMLDVREVDLIGDYLKRAGVESSLDERMTLRVSDCVLYLREASRRGARYDLIVVFTSPPTTALANRLYTLEFFRLAGEVLGDDGVIVLPLFGGENYAGPLISLGTASIVKTLLGAGFSEVALIPGETSYLVASGKAGIVPKSDAELMGRYVERGVSDPAFSSEAFFGMMPRERVSALIGQAGLFMRKARYNTTYNPQAYLFQLLVLDQMAGGRIAGWMGLSETPVGPAVLEGGLKLTFDPSDLTTDGRRAKLWPFVVGVLAAALVFMTFAKKADKLSGGAILCGLVTTGMGAMSFEIIALYLYQASFGVLYHKVGLLIASYMFGLAAGALAYKVFGRPTLKSFLIAEAVVAALLFAPLLWRGGFVFAPGFVLALVVFGSIAGFQLSLGGSMLEGIYGVGTAAARIEATDHAGAMVGSIATGLLMVPVLGIMSSILVLAFLKIVSLLAVAGVYSRYRG